jgi:hypothetical protein
VGITAQATDADTGATVTYSLSDNAGGRFAINAATGVVTVANGALLDYETTTSHSITVLATSSDGSPASSQAFSISVTNLNDNAVSAVSDTDGATGGSVAENASTGMAVGITAHATDNDSGAVVTYSLSDNAGGRFAINATSGLVTVANGTLLDYETATSHSITVLATSSDGSTNSQAFTIGVTNLNDNPVSAVTDTNATANSVAENASNGTAAGITAHATDADAGAVVTYTLSDNAGGRFAIDASSGVVTVANGTLLDYETATSHTITVLATSSDGSTNSQAFTIGVTNLNDNPVSAVTDTNATANSVAENASNGTAVGITAQATDADTGATVTYSLSDNAGGRFAINASSGVVTVANGTLLDYEANTSHSITVLATSSDGSTNSQSFTIGVSNVNDNPVSTVTDSNAVANSVAENASNGTLVGITAHATDADVGAVVTYTLSNNAGGRFAIDATTGAVTVANSTLLNYETATSHSITVLATSSDGSTNSQSFTIGVTNVNEAPVNTVPGTQEVQHDTNLSITGMSISDVDAGNATITTTLTVLHGNLTVLSAGGAAVSGSGTGTVTLSGSQAQINTTLAAANNIVYKGVANFVGIDTLTVSTNDGGNTGSGGAQTDTEMVTINVDSSTTTTLTTSADTVFYGTGTHTVIGSETTLANADKLTGGTGTDTLNITMANSTSTNFTFGNGTSSIGLTNFENIVLTDANNGTHTVTMTFNANFQNSGVIAVDATSVSGNNASFVLNASATSNSISVTGSSKADNIAGGSGTDTIKGGGASDTLSGGAGNDKFVYSTQSESTHSAFDTISDFQSGSDLIEFKTVSGITLVGSSLAGATASVAAHTIAWFTSGGQTIVYGNGTNGALNAGNANLLEIKLSGVASLQASDFLVGTAPAGTAGEQINLGLTAPAESIGATITVNVAGAPADWTLNGGTRNGDGSWTLQTTDPSALTITTPSTYAGAMDLAVTMNWINADGSTGVRFVADNVEIYAPGSAIFALSSDDHLTGSSGADLFVFAQPITNDTLHNFDTAADKIDLIGFAGFTTFADVQAHMVNDANGNAVLTLDNGETITVLGVDAAALNANNFVFDQEPVTINSGTLTISDGAIMPFSGIIENTGTIALASTGNDTNLEILVHSVTLQGGGHVTLSDSSHNVLFGGTAEATLTNVDNIISGAGQLGNGQMMLANAGTIIADGSNALVIDTGSHAVTNSGTLEASGSGGLVINSGLDNSGNLWANGGNITVHGDVAGTGSATISGTATLEFGGAANEHTTFADGGDGTLVLDHSATFTGAVSGFNAGDSLVFGDIFGAAATLAYSANAAGTGGTLILNDGDHTANITLNGQYTSAGFHDILGQADVNIVSYTANAGDQLQYGTSGDDLLSGGAGNDILIGGAGDDVLAGGLGNDTFDYNLLTDHGAAGDVVTDFSKSGANGTDVLDLHDLLQGFAGYDGTNAFTGGYLQFTAAGENTVVQVDSNGGGDSFVTLVTLNNVLLVPSDTHNLFT